MRGFGGPGHVQDRVSSPERIGHGFLRAGIRHPLAVHHQAVFVVAGRQKRFLQPMAASDGLHLHGFGGRVPVVKCTRNTNGGGRRMVEGKVDWHQLEISVRGVIVVKVVFHNSGRLIEMGNVCLLKRVPFPTTRVRGTHREGYGVLPAQTNPARTWAKDFPSTARNIPVAAGAEAPYRLVMRTIIEQTIGRPETAHGSLRIMRLARALGIIWFTSMVPALGLVFGAPLPSTYSATLAWNRSPSLDVMHVAAALHHGHWRWHLAGNLRFDFIELPSGMDSE